MNIWLSDRDVHGFARLRAGWRLALFLLVLIAPAVVLRLAQGSAAGGGGAGVVLMPLATAASEGFVLVWVVLITWLFAWLEGQRLGHFGLPARQAFGKHFWQGALWGAAALTLLLALIAASGDFSFGSPATHGSALVRFGLEWAVAFLAVAFFEEFTFRGYALTTLTEGIGFWGAAAILSIAFGSIHLGNSGESYVGAASAGLIGLFFCFTWLRTGNLWFAVGLHAAWDYCESFVYGVPDSGLVSRGRLLAPDSHGSRWITGGSVGPEGSLWVFVVIALLFFFFNRLYPAKSFSPAAPEEAASAG